MGLKLVLSISLDNARPWPLFLVISNLCLRGLEYRTVQGSEYRVDRHFHCEERQDKATCSNDHKWQETGLDKISFIQNKKNRNYFLTRAKKIKVVKRESGYFQIRMITQILTRVKSKLACSIFAKIRGTHGPTRPHWAARLHRSDFRHPPLAGLIQYTIHPLTTKYAILSTAVTREPGNIGIILVAWEGRWKNAGVRRVLPDR